MRAACNEVKELNEVLELLQILINLVYVLLDKLLILGGIKTTGQHRTIILGHGPKEKFLFTAIYKLYPLLEPKRLVHQSARKCNNIAKNM